jgi:hypothetical protein
MTSSPEQLTRKWFEDIWNHRRLETIDELMGEPCVIHDPGTSPADVRHPAEFRAMAEGLYQAFSDIHVEIKDLLTVGEQTVMRCLVTGTARATKRPIRISGMAWGRWRNGKLVEAWNNFDLLSMYEQLGALERPA